MKPWQTVQFVVLVIWTLFAIYGALKSPEASSQQTIDLEGQECIDACIKAMRDNQVFPDFQAIIKDCDTRFGDGCRLVNAP